MDNASTRAQLLEHFLSFFMPEGILDFFQGRHKVLLAFGLAMLLT
jgi:hypothetical protein